MKTIGKFLDTHSSDLVTRQPLLRLYVSLTLLTSKQALHEGFWATMGHAIVTSERKESRSIQSLHLIVIATQRPYIRSVTPPGENQQKELKKALEG